MVRVGGFLKTQNRIRRQRARGRFISPYQVGGTIFGKSTMARYPLMYTSSRLLDQHLRRKMKGGTNFGKSTRMRKNPLRFPSAYPEDLIQWARTMARRRMKGGTIFGKSTRMRSRNPLGFPEDPRKVLWANQAKARKQRKGIKRGRR